MTEKPKEYILKFKQLSLVFFIIIVSMSLYAGPAKKDNINMFPQAQEGFERYVIEVPALDNENDHKVELFIGQVMNVDCNNHILMGKVEKKILKGWGYTYLEASDINGMTVSTRMACNQPNTDKFISLAPSAETLSRYISRSPIVIYIPKGYEVRYRIWSADKAIEQSAQR
jgi:ecotin